MTCCHLGGELEALDEAFWGCISFGGNVKGGAVIGRRSHEGQTECNVHGGVEGNGLDRDQSLIMVHSNGGVVALASTVVEDGIGRMGPSHVVAIVTQIVQRGDDDLDFFSAEFA